MDVKPESFVIPADIVSGIGEGNTKTGFAIFNKMFDIPGGTAPNVTARANGGNVPGNVPIMAAGGEFVVPPEVVARIGDGDIKRGHKILHEMVKHMRAQNIKKLKKMPNPHR